MAFHPIRRSPSRLAQATGKAGVEFILWFKITSSTTLDALCHSN
jgi:hypothetical protein